VSYLVGFGMLREMGALMTGIIMAGRTGAAFAAELGSMKITEEIDAYTTLGISPIDHLVLPRMLGLFVMMPLLVIYANFVGIAGGMLVAVTSARPVAHAVHGRAAVRGHALRRPARRLQGIGLRRDHRAGRLHEGAADGLRCQAVGRSATSAVVMGITLIIVANAVVDWLAALLQV
jgi:phospholipid/cholesterol/gamma-HCH transport system permease protein